MSPRLRLIVQILISLYVVAGLAAQTLAEQAHWQKYLPMVFLAAGAVTIAALASLICAWMSKEGGLCKASWALLGFLLGAQGLYEWLVMQQVVGDEDALVVTLCVAASLVVYILIRLEYLKDETKNILLAGMVGQTLAAITDASDGGLYVLNGLTSSSFSWVADLFDLIWTPAYAIVLTYVALELVLRRSKSKASVPAGERIIWILSNGRLGDLQQMKVLAAQLGWATDIKKVHLRGRLRLNLQCIAPFLFEESMSDNLRGEAPDLVITAEAPLTPVARWIKKRSGSRTRLVHIGRPAGNNEEIDLLITSRQFPIPAQGNVLALPAPLTEAKNAQMTPSDWDIVRRLEELPRPITAVLIGGRSPPYQFDPEDAVRLSARCCRLKDQIGGSIVISTSPRTGVMTEAGLQTLADAAAYAYRWSVEKGSENPYKAMLHCADQFVVTIDSVSMIADAISTGKPVFIHELAQKPKSLDLLIRWLSEFRTETSPLRFANPVFWLFWLGIAYLRADRSEFIRELKDSGLVREWPAIEPRMPVASGELCKLRIESLFPGS